MNKLDAELRSTSMTNQLERQMKERQLAQVREIVADENKMKKAIESNMR
jgi:hypothetical protein